MAEGGLASEHFFTFLLMTGLVAGSIGGLAAQFSALQRGLGAIDTLMDLLHEKREPVRAAGELPATGSESEHPTDIEQAAADWLAPSLLPKLKGQVQFAGVSFHYPNRPDMPVLSGLNLTIEAGQQIALVGASGAGKSTIASLLLRFHEPTEGEITVDGLPLSEFPLTGYRMRIAYVPQEVILFGGDIRSNIAYGKPGATQAEIEDAARQANAHAFIEAFPEGYETLVGDRGVQLSGGQRQRIAIARAILRDPDLLILDEATSALDTASEKEVQVALERLMKGRSSLVIAHRLSTIRHADRIAVLHQGHVAEQGTHDGLMAQTGLYHNLVQNQQLLSSH